ncbi:hypothetical protein JTE90_003768 [Oedothorax gibbosus]|uniref:Uncharacterized protein n=1 Tax=Oedothorax gibbosus TaxID=931172 RepID=A0AAV6VBG0_9ARAC|nr:hypothetical protein JTE90_003768 [Oedothorax gibbosus]
MSVFRARLKVNFRATPEPVLSELHTNANLRGTLYGPARHLQRTCEEPPAVLRGTVIKLSLKYTKSKLIEKAFIQTKIVFE